MSDDVMNKRIVGLLRIPGASACELYAADRIEELEQQLATQVEIIGALREALKELAYWKIKDGDCWCPTVPAKQEEEEAHSPGCQRARAAFARLAARDSGGSQADEGQ